MNRYKKAAPGKEEEGTFYQIKCEVCGFKDATKDKSTWTCPDCEIKTKRVIAVKDAIVKHAEITTEDTIKIQTKPKALDEWQKAIQDITGIKPPAPAEVKQSFKVGGLQCKIVTTKRK